MADASHELRTPLTSIRGYAELFRRGAADRPEDLATAMRRIEEESARMGVLVEDLLLLARLDQGRSTRPSRAPPLERPRRPVPPGRRRRRRRPGRVPDSEIVLSNGSPVMVLGDELRLRQVAANLLSNAQVHTPPGTVGAGDASTAAGDRARLVVSDDGPGLPPDVAERVFERFFRVDKARSRATAAARAWGCRSWPPSPRPTAAPSASRTAGSRPARGPPSWSSCPSTCEATRARLRTSAGSG